MRLDLQDSLWLTPLKGHSPDLWQHAYGIERIESLRTADRQGNQVRPKSRGYFTSHQTRIQRRLRQLRMRHLMLTTDWTA